MKKSEDSQQKTSSNFRCFNRDPDIETAEYSNYPRVCPKKKTHESDVVFCVAWTPRMGALSGTEYHI